MTDFEKSVRTVLKNCLSLKPKDSLLIVAEDALDETAEFIWKCAKRLTKKLILTKFDFKNLNGHNLPGAIYSSLQYSNTSLILCSNCLQQLTFNTEKQNGARILVLENASRRFVERAFVPDYKKISNLSRKLADLFSIGKKVRLQSPSGTDAMLTIARIKGKADTGIVDENGGLMFLPAGEASLSLNHKNIDGRVVLDRIAGVRKKLANPILLNVNDGHVLQIRGGEEAQLLKRDLRKFKDEGRKIYELGVGTNKSIVLGRSAKEDEKSFGNVHISLGKNQTTKSNTKLLQAVKGIVLKPTLTIDDRLIIKDGKFLV